MSKYDNDKVYEYEKTIEEQEKIKKDLQDHLDTLKEDLAVSLVDFSNTTDATQGAQKERLINAKSEEEKAKQAEFYASLDAQRKALVSWRKRLAAHYERGHQVEKSNILPKIGVGATSFVNTDWEGRIIDYNHITFYKDKKLGEGAFGTVYRGMVYGNIVAIKRLKEPVSDGVVNVEVSRSNATNSFEQECKLLANLKNPNILRFMGASFLKEGTEEEKKDETSKFLNCCILTEFGERGSLHDIMYGGPRDGGLRVKFTLIRKFTAIGQIVEGMVYLHSVNVLHLDLKPANILLDAEYNVRIADFGMSRINKNQTFITAIQNFIAGTPYYMAPEILLENPGGPGLSTKCDVYSFGILLNEFLNEEIPYNEMLGQKPTLDNLRKIVGENTRPPLYSRDKQEGLKALIKDCWAGKPEDRPEFTKIFERKDWENAKKSLVTDAGQVRSKLQTAISDKAKDSRIKVEDFIKILKDTHGLESELHKQVKNNHAALDLFLGVPNRETYPDVDLTVINRFLTWFDGYKSSELIPAIQQVVKTKWFFGVMSTPDSETLLSLPENQHTGTYLVRWDNDEFVISFVFSEQKKKKIGHKSTGKKSLQPLFENENIWKKDNNLKKNTCPIRPPGYRYLEGVFNNTFLTSGTSYVLKIDGVSSSAPTQQEQMNIQRGLPAFDMVL